MVPIIWRASSFLVFFVFPLRGWIFHKPNRKEEEETEQQQTYQFTQSYNILHRLQVHLTFITHTNINTICDRTCEKGPCRASFQNRVITTIGKVGFELQNALHT